MFRNRGSVPNIDIENPNPNYPNFLGRRYIIIHYDKTFMLMEVMSFLLIAIIVIAALFWGYPITFEDPIATMKDDFITSQLIMIGISIISIAIVTIFSKEKENLVKALQLIAIITMLMIIVQVMIKSNIDNEYNEEIFGQFYEQINTDTNEDEKNFSIGMSGMSLISAKESYIQKSMDAFNNFKMKTTLYIMLHIIVEFVVIYLLYRLKIFEAKREKHAKDDLILDDEEQNIIY